MTTTPTSDLTLLLRAVLTDPADLTARLIYADCLEEQNTPPARERAAFIRHDCNILLSGGYYSSHVGSAAPTRRHYRPWMVAELDELPFPSSCVWEASYVGGFLASLWVPAADFLAHAAAVFGAHLVTSVTLTDREPATRGLVTRDMHGWFRGTISDFANTNWKDIIPPALWDRIGGGEMRTDYWKLYPTADDARQALSRACVTYGRAIANLPPLNETTPA